MKPFQKLVIGLALSFAYIVNGFGQLSWQPTNSIDSFMVSSLLSHGNELYAGMFGAGVYKTDDEGETWEECNNGLTSLIVRVLEKKGNTLYAGTKEAGIFKSTNKGKTWQSITSEPLHYDVWSILTNQNRLFVGTSAGLFFTDNDGGTWQKANLPRATTHHRIILALAAQGSKILAGSNSFIYLSDDSGETWEAIRLPTHLNVTSIKIHGNRWIIGTSGHGLYVSQDGKDWEVYDKPVGNIRTILPVNTELFLALPEQGVIKDTVAINEGFDEPHVKSLGFHQGKIYAGTYRDGVWRYDLPQLPQFKIANKPNKQVNLYPNPTPNGSVTLEYELETTKTVSIRLFDSFGKQIAEILPNSEQAKGFHQRHYDLSNLKNGTYFFQFLLGKEQITKAIVVIQ